MITQRAGVRAAVTCQVRTSMPTESREQRDMAALPILLKAKHKLKKKWHKFTGEPETERRVHEPTWKGANDRR